MPRKARLFPPFLLAAACVPASGAAPARGATIAGTVEGVSPAGAAVWLEGDSIARGRPVPAPPHISQKGARFRPALSVVVAGQDVEFPNDDDVVHNVFSISRARAFDLGLYRPGIRPKVHFDRPGVVDLFCKIHENMHATLVVVPSPLFVTTDASGRFAIPDVPPGRYVVEAYSPGAGRGSAPAEAPSGAEVRLHVTGGRR